MYQDPTSPFGSNIVRNMTSTRMMMLVGPLEKLSASKAAAEKKAKEKKESLQKVEMFVDFDTVLTL